MCLYHYVYYSRCQHSELIRVSYCDRAKALGHPQRDDRYRRDAGADNPPERPPGYPSHNPSYPVNTHSVSATHHHTMSTLTPSEAGADLAWADSGQSLSLPHTDRIPRSAQGYNNVNIDIPLDTQSSLSMEFSHDGKVMELVARFESFTEHEDSDAEQAHQRDYSRPQNGSTDTVMTRDLQHSTRMDESDTDTVRASQSRHEAPKKAASPQSHKSIVSPRKPIPSPWKMTQPRAPVFQTDRRKAEREKRKSIQGSLSPTKSSRSARSSTYLTKDAIEAVDSDITSASGPTLPTKITRQHSKASLQSPATSPARSSPRQTATIKIQVSPARNTRSNVHNGERAPSVTPSVTSNQGTEYHSAHSPVSFAPSRALSRRSSRDTWHTAEDNELEPPPLSLTSTDVVEQSTTTMLYQDGQNGTRDKPTSKLVLHSRSKTEPHIPEKNSIRPVVPNLTLRIPAPGLPANRKPPFSSGSASSSHSSSPASPTKISSRIPRIAPTRYTDTRMTTLKRSRSTKSLQETKSSDTAPSNQADKKDNTMGKSTNKLVQESDRDPRDIPLPKTPVAVPLLRHVRTLDSGGRTPIITQDARLKASGQPYINPRLALYLDDIDPSARPDHTPFTEEEDILQVSLNQQSSRKTSTSTVKAVACNTVEEPVKDKASNHFDGDDALEESPAEPGGIPTDVSKDGKHDPILQDPAIVYSGRKLDPDGTSGIVSANRAEAPETKGKDTGTSDGLRKDYHSLRGRSNQYIPQNRHHSVSSHSLRSKGSSELRATAPEFIPQLQDGLQASGETPMITQWLQPFSQNLAFDPFALDTYGMPWFFHMYPVQMKQFFKPPKKNKTMPRARKRRDASLSPGKFARSAQTNKHRSKEGHEEAQQEPAQEVVTPFASQLDEIARNAAARQEQDALSHTRKGYMTMPPRSGRPLRSIGNGLYDAFGRGRFRTVGMPIEATAPFPDPVPPSGRKEYVGYAIEHTQDGCGVVDIDRAAEWGGKACNNCEPDH